MKEHFVSLERDKKALVEKGSLLRSLGTDCGFDEENGTTELPVVNEWACPRSSITDDDLLLFGFSLKAIRY